MVGGKGFLSAKKPVQHGKYAWFRPLWIEFHIQGRGGLAFRTKLFAAKEDVIAVYRGFVTRNELLLIWPIWLIAIGFGV